MKKSAVVVLLALVAAGCSGPPDPRAYPGSEDGVSWEEAAARYAIALPSCPTKAFRFDVQPRLRDHLIFTFEAAKSCVDGFLTKYGADPAHPGLKWPRDDNFPPFGADKSERYGWTYDLKQRSALYHGFRTPNGSSFWVFVKQGAEETVYAYSLTTGYPN
ncbi:hypothetical protein [Amycolatopsis sp. VC5-11]|uniref:hypothetical protein n=1 Tax=Amycolatopsis sp. VC5-11 TaxID=3120156 RepID=UPI00300950F2